MRNLSSIRWAAAAALMGALLAGCAKPAPAPEPAADPAPATETPAPTPAPSDTPPPSDSPTGPAQPTPDAPPPTDPNPAPKPTSAATEPSLESMRAAAPSHSKIGVPVDLRYSFDSEVLPGQPVQLHLAAIPRVAGANLRISVQQDPGLELSEGTLNVQKASAAGVYRKQLALTRQASGPAVVRVLITMGVEGGSGHGYYDIPLVPGAVAQKRDPGKSR
jgi:hypothetical protein